MSIFDLFISTIAPYNCVNCNAEGRLLCLTCVHKLQTIVSRCYRCRKLSVESRTCKSCRSASKLYRLQVGAVYDGLAKSLVAKLKFSGAQGAAKEMAEFLSQRVVINADCVIVPVPTATSRVRQRGYDQAKLLARSFAKKHGLVYLDCLARSGQAHQVGARRQQRLKQLTSAYRLKTGSLVEDLHIVLVDDVVTTGATLEAAATCLRTTGARRVEAMVFVQA